MTYSEELVELVVAPLRRLDLEFGVDPDEAPNWYQDRARSVLDALSSSGRLVPEGSEVREEWGAEHDGCEHWGIAADEAGLMQWVGNQFPGWRPLRRTVVVSVIPIQPTPWTPAEPAQEAPDA